MSGPRDDGGRAGRHPAAGQPLPGAVRLPAAPAGHATRRHLLTAAAGLTAAPLWLGACAHWGSAAGWTGRLRGDTVALLGEVHDHPALHRLRAEGLAAACDAGWRPALVLEQFDTDRQGDIDRARRERPRDAAHLVTAAGATSGWDWPLYTPLVELALRLDLPIVAGNLSRGEASRIVREGYGAVFTPARQAALGLAAPVADDLLTGQVGEIEAGHCGALPARLLEPMARAQFARDAVMAERLSQAAAAARGVVLIAGNGHVRRDLGVPRWLPAALAPRLHVVGFIERGGDEADRGTSRYDRTVDAAPIERPDPCRAFSAPRAG